MRKLAVNIEQQQKEQKKNYFKKSNFSNLGSGDSKGASTSKGLSKPKRGRERFKAVQATNAHRRCYKCQGIGHIASDCPNKKVISLIGEVYGEEDSQEEEEFEEVEYADEGECSLFIEVYILALIKKSIGFEIIFSILVALHMERFVI